MTVCLQEMKAHEADLEPSIVAPKNWHAAFSFAEKRGYSGVGIYSRAKPDSVQRGFGSHEFDREGRYVEARYGNLAVISVYFPSGSSSPERQLAKFRFLEEVPCTPEKVESKKAKIILCGDWNIAHKEIDLRNWRSQPEELRLPARGAHLDHARVRRDRLRGRVPAPQQPAGPVHLVVEPRRGLGQERRLAHRLSHRHRALAKTAKKESIYKTKRFSDHAPLTIDYDWTREQITVPAGASGRGWRRCPAAGFRRAAGRGCAACDDRATRPAPAAWRNRRA